jgi:transcriptional repressor NrdR
MYCPYCQNTETKVVDKRDSDDKSVSRRRRECLSCGKRFTTYEKVEDLKIKVVKKDGRIEDYDRTKLEKGIKISAQKRISEEEIDKIVDDIEIRILNRKTNKVAASDIGRLVLTRLKHTDKISYLRFASVFLDFENLEEFKSEINKLDN